jgi:hypothetical protein
VHETVQNRAEVTTGMTSSFVSRCFPVLAGALQSHLPYIWEYLFPDWENLRCPTPSITLPIPASVVDPVHHVSIALLFGHEIQGDSPFTSSETQDLLLPMRSPILVFFELAGILIGLSGYLLVDRTLWSWRKGTWMQGWLGPSRNNHIT